MIVYAHEYGDDPGSKQEFEEFNAWAREHVAAEVSAWRTRELEGERWFISVVDESEDGRSQQFPWSGKPFELAPQQAQAFVARRAGRALSAYVEGHRERISEKLSYREPDAPRLRADGVWESNA